MSEPKTMDGMIIRLAIARARSEGMEEAAKIVENYDSDDAGVLSRAIRAAINTPDKEP